jgi:prolyl-tRNA synthetase
MSKLPPRQQSAKPGSCGPVGLLSEVDVICDSELGTIENWLVGANVDHFHFLNINPEVDFKVTAWADVRKAKSGDLCPECKTGKLQDHRGIEVGHVFYLGDKYSKSMKATFLDEQGQTHFCEMGCYGIGVGRTVQATIEQSHDKDGMIWPINLAPYEVIVCLIDYDDAEMTKIAQKLYQDLLALGVEVLLDDREDRPGSKFKDADLIGIPLRVNVGKKSYSDQQSIEIVERKTKQLKKVKAENAAKDIFSWVMAEKEKCKIQ